MSIKENAKLQFSDKLSGELNSINVPEWGDTIYFKNAINGKKQGQIMSLYDKGKIVDSVCMSLIMRALDKDGNAIRVLLSKSLTTKQQLMKQKSYKARSRSALLFAVR